MILLFLFLLSWRLSRWSPSRSSQATVLRREATGAGTIDQSTFSMKILTTGQITARILQCTVYRSLRANTWRECPKFTIPLSVNQDDSIVHHQASLDHWREIRDLVRTVYITI